MGPDYFPFGERVYSTRQLCQLFDLSAGTVKTWRVKHGLVYEILFKKIYFRKGEVEAFMKKHGWKGGRP
jgi:hypothetical protein